MKKLLSILTISILSVTMLSSCGRSEVLDKVENLSDYDYTKFKDKDITLNVANWGEYMSVNDPESLDVNKAFENLTGIEVNYKTVATNEELYAKLKSGGADYDIIIPSDYMISRMIKEDIIQPLNYDNIPNISYINERFINPEYDPENKYSVPYMWGVVCLIYNTKMVDEEITSWSALWDEKYSNNILMFNNPRDAFGIALLKEGFSINTEDKDELDIASKALKEQKQVVQAYVMDEIFDKMGGGSAAIAPYYAGDAVTMMAENEDLTYSLPEEGTNQFVDAICIPKSSTNKEAAEMYINFLCETEVALANCDYVGYSTPHTGAFELLDDEVKNNPLQYPPEEYLENKTEFYVNLSDDTNAYIQELWNQLKIEKTPSVWLVPILMILAIILIIVISIRKATKKKEEF